LKKLYNFFNWYKHGGGLMDAHEATNTYRLKQWADIIRGAKQSGMSINDWCASQGITRNQFFYWQRRLRKVASETLTVAKVAAKSEISPAGWAAVTVTSLEPQLLIVEVGGCRISIGKNTDTELLVKVIRTLKAL
jgi:putative transposase